MNYPKVILKPGKEKSVRTNRHPWIFSGAIDRMPSLQPGDIADVYSHTLEFLARAYVHPENSIAARIISFTTEDVFEVIKDKIERAARLRAAYIPSNTTCYRVINAEADGLPGLIVDRYADVLVMQVSTCGMEKVKEFIVKTLLALFSPRSLIEKSMSSARSQEGLDLYQGVVAGEPVDEVLVEEEGISFFVSIPDGQKTGLFLDHREMRKYIGSLAKGKKVLNCFSYTGGFSLHALCNGAEHVTSVDISETACRYAKKNTYQNHIPSDRHRIVCEDVFEFLGNEKQWDYDIVIIDPPAFAKKRKDIDSATIGYRKLNSLVLSKVKQGALVLTSSCSYYIDSHAFGRIVFQAGSESQRDIRILQHHISALDHPVSLYHPEGDYLKSLLLFVGI